MFRKSEKKLLTSSRKVVWSLTCLKWPHDCYVEVENDGLDRRLSKKVRVASSSRAVEEPCLKPMEQENVSI